MVPLIMVILQFKYYGFCCCFYAQVQEETTTQRKLSGWESSNEAAAHGESIRTPCEVNEKG